MKVFSVKSKKNGEVWYLHAKIITMKGQKPRCIYYFGRTITKEFAIDAVPTGFEISHNMRTGMPLLKKIKV